MAFNFGKTGLGALGGAASGASLGTMFAPGIGTAIGAGAGGLFGGLSGLFGGTESSNTQVGSPQQVAGRQQVLMQALQGLGQNKADFAPIAQQARTQFAQSTIPGIAERFSGMGAQGSSAFGQQLGQAGAGLEQGLAGMESQHNLQQQGLLQSLLGLGLGGENIHQPAEQGFGQEAILGLLKNPATYELLMKYFQGSGAGADGVTEGVK